MKVKTSKGTELPLLNLKGKWYLQVPHRVMWFREEHPDYSIETEFVNISEDASISRAVIKDASGRILATAHKSETRAGFGDYLEKSESGAIGRALGFLGFGTAYALELEEADRIVDAPQEPTQKPSITTQEHSVKGPVKNLAPQSEAEICSACGGELRFSEKKKVFYCANFADKSRKHDYLTQELMDNRKKMIAQPQSNDWPSDEDAPPL